MGRNKDSLQHVLVKRVLPAVENNKTATAYKRHIKVFAAWAKAQGYIKPAEITRETVQEYEQYLEYGPKQYSPWTIHSYLAPVCAAADVHMEEIRKPRRTAEAITRGRSLDAEGNEIVKNRQGRREEKNPKYVRLVALQRAVGIRRAELGRLTGADLVRKDGRWYVRVRRGKGGKDQMQLLLPEDVEAVKAVFAGIGPEENVFSHKEMKNKINLHGIRQAHSRDCYAHYEEIVEGHPEVAEQLRAVLLARWEEGHEKLKREDPKAWDRQRKRFISDMDDRRYLLRGENLRKAQALGLPTDYNRLALMCVSVLHLSHWRLDVTSVNYLVTR